MRLDIDNFGRGEVEFDDRNAGGFEVGEEAELGGEKEEEGAAFGVGAAGCTADAVNVVAWVVGGLELDDPVDVRNLSYVS